MKRKAVGENVLGSLGVGPDTGRGIAVGLLRGWDKTRKLELAGGKESEIT